MSLEMRNVLTADQWQQLLSDAKRARGRGRAQGAAARALLRAVRPTAK